jgi:hypothetical protein
LPAGPAACAPPIVLTQVNKNAIVIAHEIMLLSYRFGYRATRLNSAFSSGLRTDIHLKKANRSKGRDAKPSA